jgi:chitinase
MQASRLPSSYTYPIFYQGVTEAQRFAFAQSYAFSLVQYGLDGLDFDWEYPGAPNLPDVSPGSPSDGPNYLNFLQMVSRK